jgi:hypothetical protein
MRGRGHELIKMVYLLIESVGSGAVPSVGWGRFVTDRTLDLGIS